MTEETKQGEKLVVIVFKGVVQSFPITREEAESRLRAGLDKIYNFEAELREVD